MKFVDSATRQRHLPIEGRDVLMELSHSPIGSGTLALRSVIVQERYWSDFSG